MTLCMRAGARGRREHPATKPGQGLCLGRGHSQWHHHESQRGPRAAWELTLRLGTGAPNQG